MSKKGNPYDNAFAESFIKTLKAEKTYYNSKIDAFIEQMHTGYAKLPKADLFLSKLYLQLNWGR